MKFKKREKFIKKKENEIYFFFKKKGMKFNFYV